ncbi:MAG: motility associated factor glycosyltransferase family protein [Syntrophorhabdus aromaticivorans]|uniref:Motility associated factor glycosyltransferase family protein n=1 Tax=Syntrophorhabdus aromaticivorans TaxID=328301 RepID=A0A971M249_9BACT|nr:motility associated factor glycosyltransferase family protein [Syntrophorhabdus aromaticivorans]
MPALLEQNLRTLEKSQPKLAARLRQELDSIDRLPLAEVRETSSGRWVKVEEDAPFFDTTPVLPSRNKTEDDSYCYLVQGIGYPPYLFHLLRGIAKDALSIVVLEPDVRLLLLTLSVTSVFHAAPQSARISFIAYDERSLIDEAMFHNVTPIGIFPLLQSREINHRGLLEKDQENSRSRLFKSFWESIRYYAEQLGNSPEDTLLGIRHGALNTPWILKGPSFSNLKEAFGGRPAICVASGPSLKKNVDLLKGKEDQFLIVSCDSSLISLLRRGIRPHIVVTIERNLMYDVWVPNVLEEFYDECRDILLVSQSVSEPQTAGRWPGPVFVVGKMDSPADRWLVHDVLGMNLLLSGMCVAHMAMNVALVLGAPAVALIGQDLAFAEDGETTHIEDAASATPEGIARERAYLKREVPGVNGGLVKTHQMWFYYLQIFERFLDHVEEGRVFQCSEAGASIKGTTALPLSRFLEEQSTEESLPPLSDGIQLHSASKDNFVEYQKELAERLDVAKAGLSLCDGLIEEMEKEVDRAVAPALLPDRRRNHAIKAATLLDQIHASHKALAFIGQSYTHIAGSSLAKNRFLDTMEQIRDWEEVHRGIIASHRVNVRFLRQWLSYMETVCNPRIWSVLESYSSLNENEVVREIPSVLAGFFEGNEPQNMLSEKGIALSYLLNRVDMIRHEDVAPQDLWNLARFLSLQGRPFEACRFMQRAYAMLEGKEAVADTVVQFLFDWAKMESAHDLIREPRFEFALSLLQNIPERAPEMVQQVELEKSRLLDMQRDFMDGLFRILPSCEERTLLSYRNRAQKALASQNLPETFAWVMKMGEFLEKIPNQVFPYMQWLAKTALDCRGAVDTAVDQACSDALAFLLDKQNLLASLGFLWPTGWASYLQEHGIEVGYVQDEQSPET